MEATDKHSDGNATQTDTMSTDRTDSSHDQEPFQFMRLPPELRLMVYQFALHDVTDPIMFPPSGGAQKPHPGCGALAILQTSKHIRQESHQAMKRIARNHYRALIVACRTIGEREVRLLESEVFESIACRQAEDDYERASHQADCMEVVTEAMHNVFMAKIAEYKARSKKHLAALLSPST